MTKYQEIDLKTLERFSIQDRKSIVDKTLIASNAMLDLSAFQKSLPNILKAKDLIELVSACKKARETGKAIIIGLGGHVIKCGLAPLLIAMMDAGYVSAFMVNGSVVIHDFEMAMYGNTSEDVSTALEDGSFGMAIETADTINHAISRASEDGLGYGEGMGKLLSGQAQFGELSLLANAYSRDIPVCVHVAIGTDIIHQHPSADGKAIVDCSLRDFRIICEIVKQMDDGGIFINFGSAVIIPEVFLKALSVARNIQSSVHNFTTAVFDMNLHYRPQTNIVNRPNRQSGKGYYFIGHHEIMIPLFVNMLFSD